MSGLTKVLLGGAAAILVFDGVCALASRQFGFDYTMAAVGSYLLYAAIGYPAAKVGGIRAAAVAGAVTGLVDSTLGWVLAWKLGVARMPEGGLTPGRWAAAALIVIVIGAALACIGGVSARATRSPRAPIA